MKISEATPDTSVSGAELIPVSDAGTSKSMTVTKVKDFVVDSIEAISAGSSVGSSDGVYVLQSGVLKPINVDLICQRAIDTVWGKVAETSLSSSGTLAYKSSGVEKTVTLSTFLAYVLSSLKSSMLDVSTLADGSATLASTDYVLVGQGSSAKRIQVSNLSSLIYSALASHVAGVTSSTPSSSDVFYVVRSGVPYTVTLAQLATYFGVSLSGSGTVGFLASWADTDVLAAGPAVVTDIGAGSDDAVPTSQAVVEYVADNSGWDGTITDINISGAADVATALTGTELVVVNKGANSTNVKSAVSRFWTYIQTQLQAVTSLVGFSFFIDEDSMATNSTIKVPSQKSVKSYVDTKFALAGWTYIQTQLQAVASLVGFSFFVDEDNMASDSAAKVPSQQSVKSYVDTKFAAAGVDIFSASAKSIGLDADKTIISDSEESGASKTFTLSNLWNYIESKIKACAGKTTPVDADIVMIQDSAASFGYREVLLSNFFTWISTKFGALTAKTTPVDADQFAIMDSAASNGLKKVTGANMWANWGAAKAKLIKLDEFAAPTDVTTLNVSTSAHGLCPKLPNNTTTFLRGDGTFAAAGMSIKTVIPDEITFEYQLVLGDAQCFLLFTPVSPTDVGCVIPTNSTVAFPVGTNIEIYNTMSDYGVSIYGSGVTFNGNFSDFPTVQPHCFATLTKIGTDSWVAKVTGAA